MTGDATDTFPECVVRLVGGGRFIGCDVQGETFVGGCVISLGFAEVNGEVVGSLTAGQSASDGLVALRPLDEAIGWAVPEFAAPSNVSPKSE